MSTIVESKIIIVRDKRVILDRDLADLYGVNTKRLNEQISRNIERFPNDFMFQLSLQEVTDLKSQIATSSFAHGGRRKLPRAFTEFGAVMAGNVLNSKVVLVSWLNPKAFSIFRAAMGILYIQSPRLGDHPF